jgi:hypothetical protein
VDHLRNSNYPTCCTIATYTKVSRQTSSFNFLSEWLITAFSSWLRKHFLITCDRTVISYLIIDHLT